MGFEKKEVKPAAKVSTAKAAPTPAKPAVSAQPAKKQVAGKK